MKFAIYAQKYKPEYKKIIEKLVLAISEHQSTLCFEKKLYDAISTHHILSQPFETFEAAEDLDENTDFFISIGGDGTMLRAANFVKNHNIPLIGINAGRLGFLANIQENAIEFLIPLIFSNQYTLSRRTLLQVNAPADAIAHSNFALNEITITRKNTTSMITIDTYVNDEFLATYWADGIIISTPTGSTGYNLSCGGPIITPSSNCLVITPIAPHNLTTRPLILSDLSKIRMRIESREKEYLLSVDSDATTLATHQQVEVSTAKQTVNIVEFPSVTFLKTLRNKLLWGEDKRN